MYQGLGVCIADFSSIGLYINSFLHLDHLLCQNEWISVATTCFDHKHKSGWYSGDAEADAEGLVTGEDWVRRKRGLRREVYMPLPKKMNFSPEMACFCESA